jgi:carbonic anhydrase
MTHFPKTLLLSFLSGCLLLMSTSCKKTTTTAVVLPSCTGQHFEYEGADGPDHWKELCVDWTPCGGKVQSPVNLTSAIYDPSSADIAQTYTTTATNIVNNGHTIQFNYDAGSSIVVNGDTYNLLQFHTHTHSEHTLNGKSYPMEIHFVHKNTTTGKLAVIGVLVEEGAENDVLKHLVDHLPANANDTYTASDVFNAADLFPHDKSYFTYSGSLTTPPCSEIVTWMVMEHPIEASTAQIHDFETLEHENFRPIQAIEGRAINYHKG